MSWLLVCRDIPEGKPILISYGEQAVVALAYPADYYCPEMTFLDARTLDILPAPSHWMPLPERPLAAKSRDDISVSRRVA